MRLFLGHRHALLLAALLVAAGCGNDEPHKAGPARAPAVTVFAERDPAQMRAVLDRYSAETGVPIQLTTETGRALITRLAAEKHKATADLVLTEGVAHLWRATEEDVLRPAIAGTLTGNVPVTLRDPDNFWFGLLTYGRVIAYDQRVIDREDLTGYAGLGDERWRGKLCLSSATDSDNRALVAMMIAEHGERATELAVRAWVANLAGSLLFDDVSVLQAIEEGRCSLGIANSDEIERFRRDLPDTGVAMFWPPASSGGAYINIVGAGVTRHAGNPGGAQALLEWLASGAGQELLVGTSLQYPLKHQMPADLNPADIAGAGYFREDAIELMERARYGAAY